jgi:aryl-alcohol dehydrogenase-like predicted oxidoreductase
MPIMQKRKLGKSGIEVSEIGLGCWQLGGDFGPLATNGRRKFAGGRPSGIDFWGRPMYGRPQR